ncbi:MAG TPA: hypothetical protein VFM09_02885 [Marmoricola sp.]|nr:hypothetical protein [Marmoricola sp.]
MTDPLSLLETLGKDLAAGPPHPWPPDQVRRRGDRLRHRRTALQALGAAAALAVAVTGGVMLTGQPSRPQPTAPVITHPGRPHHAGRHVLGPDGYRGLRLGMDAAQVRATGDATVPRVPASGCAGIRLTDRPRRPHRVDGYLSARYGLVAVYARSDMATPEGIHPGSTFAQVRKAYPDGKLSVDGYWIVPLGHGTAYEFGIGGHHAVGEMAVMRLRQDCFN